MPLTHKSEHKRRVLAASRDNAISSTLFRNAVSRELGLSRTDFDGLDLVLYRGSTTPSELAGYTGLSSGSTTTMIDRLERRGLVTRQNNPHDRRGTLVRVTEEAACQVGPLFTSLRVAQNELLGTYTLQELELLSDYFQKSTGVFMTGLTQVANLGK